MLAALNTISLLGSCLLWFGFRRQQPRVAFQIAGVVAAFAGVIVAAVALATKTGDRFPYLFMEVGLGLAAVLGVRAIVRPQRSPRAAQGARQVVAPGTRFSPRMRLLAILTGLAAFVVITVLLNLLVFAANR